MNMRWACRDGVGHRARAQHAFAVQVDLVVRVEQHPAAHVELSPTAQQQRAVDVLLHHPARRALRLSLRLEKGLDLGQLAHQLDPLALGAVARLQDPDVLAPAGDRERLGPRLKSPGQLGVLVQRFVLRVRRVEEEGLRHHGEQLRLLLRAGRRLAQRLDQRGLAAQRVEPAVVVHEGWRPHAVAELPELDALALRGAEQQLEGARQLELLALLRALRVLDRVAHRLGA